MIGTSKMCEEHLWNSEISIKDACNLWRTERCVSTGHMTFRTLQLATDVFHAFSTHLPSGRLVIYFLFIQYNQSIFSIFLFIIFNLVPLMGLDQQNV